jgi:CRISPR-associated protein Csc3
VKDPDKSPMHHPQKLTELYRKFYRAKQRYNPKANAVLKPIDIAADTLLKADFAAFHGETLVMTVAAEICKLMDRVRSANADGRWIISGRDEERLAVVEFAKYFVVEVFEKTFAGDRARLAGRQLNLLRDTCELLYRLENDRENKEYEANKKPGEPTKPEEEEEDEV